MDFLHVFEHSIIPVAVEIGVIMFEMTGIIAMLITGIKGIYSYVTKNPEHHTHHILAKGMSMGLAFLLGGELLHTVTAHSFADIGIVACIFLVRAAITFLLHWEKLHENDGEEHEEHEEHHA